MELHQSLSEKGKDKPKGRLRYESMLKSLPPDILQDLVKRKLAEIALILDQQENKTKST